MLIIRQGFGWMRVDGPERGKHLAFDTMENRPIIGTRDWTKYEVILDVATDATAIAFGVLLAGSGTVWMDDFQFDEVGGEVATTNLTSKCTSNDRAMNLNFEES